MTPLIAPERLPFWETISHLCTANPFEPVREDLLKAALGELYLAPGSCEGARRRRLGERVGWAVALAVNTKLRCGIEGTPAELALYQVAAVYYLWDFFGPRIQKLIDDDAVEVPFYDEFVDNHRDLLGYPGITAPEPAHLLALLYQARRAWHFAASKIAGKSPSAAAARSAIWRANMGSDIHVYAESLYRHMDEIPVLITGETGTGKDLAAECVGWSRYIPFDAGARRFVRRYAEDFHARNICEVPAELLESALFGHKRGSFTGATTDTPGCFALPRQHGTLFLDEAGEISEHVQVKLLRPFQNREYVPIGETRPRPILGRLVFATHRDLEERCREGKFRADLLERMNGMHIHMPSLRQMIAEVPDELRRYVGGFLVGKIDSPARAERWTERVVNSIYATKYDYQWPRNLRELRNYTERYILTDGHKATPAAPAPARAPAPQSAAQATISPPGGVPSSGILGPKAKAGEVSLEELNRSFVTWMHLLSNQNTAETARRTGVDRRTVSRWLDHSRLARWLKRKK